MLSWFRKHVPGPPRVVYIGQNDVQEGPPSAYPSNQVISSKYTLVTFLPRNILEQFRRLANVFFLAIAILQFFPIFSTISPGLVLFPLLVVMTFTAIKDAYEDVKRHNADRAVNQSTVLILAGSAWHNPNPMKRKQRTFVRGTRVSDDDDSPLHWRPYLWEDLRVGDIVKLKNDQSVPADILLCSSSEDNDLAFIETKNLDGETSLKSRHSVPLLSSLRAPDDFHDVSFQVHCDRPDPNMFKLGASVHKGSERAPVDISMTLLRGTVLRNTQWAVGVVLFTGRDTKVVLNTGRTPSKMSRMERTMNYQVSAFRLCYSTLRLIQLADSSISLFSQFLPSSAVWLTLSSSDAYTPLFGSLVQTVSL